MLKSRNIKDIIQLFKQFKKITTDWFDDDYNIVINRASEITSG